MSPLRSNVQRLLPSRLPGMADAVHEIEAQKRASEKKAKVLRIQGALSI